MDELIGTIRNYVTGSLQNHGAHGLDHTLRVTCLCEKIGGREKSDMRILIAAALLHDIARPFEEETGVPHEEEGARIAKTLLKSIGYPPDLIPAVTHAILTHRYRTKNKPRSREAMILSDADKLDAMGAIGIARAFMTAGERAGDVQDAIDHIQDKLLKLRGLMYMDTSREIADTRHIYLKNFIETLHNELDTRNC